MVACAAAASNRTRAIQIALRHIRTNRRRRSPGQNPAQPSAFLWIEERSRFRLGAAARHLV
jgi:hypothetical protein